MTSEANDTWHREVLSAAQHQVLTTSQRILAEGDIEAFLAGGAGLALRIGHRRSQDLDWFTTSSFDVEQLAQQVAALPDARVIMAEPGTFHGEISGIPLSLIRYRYPAQADERMDGIPIVSLRTALGMKCLALVNRGYKRDFLDLAAILRHIGDVAKGLAWVTADIPGLPRESILRAMNWRADAEDQPNPDGVSDADWEAAKQAIDRAVRSVIW